MPAVQWKLAVTRSENGTMFDKVLLLSASAGAGHVRASEAIEQAFKEMSAARSVRHIDVLTLSNRLFRRFYSRGYVTAVQRFPTLWGKVYDYTDVPWQGERWRLAVEKLNLGPFIRMLEEERPDLIVSTHFMPPEIVSWLKAEKRLSCPQAVVVTDLDAHAMWLCRRYEHYYVALDETREHLAQLGVPRDAVTVSGIPIDPVFSRTKDRREVCEKHGLRPDVTTILISAGGFGMGPIEKVMKALLRLEHPAQIIPICGRSEPLERRLEAIVSRVPAGHHVSAKVVGFTREMDEFMTASDILVGKPGGLTMSEGLVKGLVFVISDPIPGQEERNTDHLLEEGVALRCNNLPVLAWKIDRLLDDPKRFAAMRDNALKLARPRAAFDIVEKLLSLRKSWQ
jgi:processive 1,2-diacylglycerol beta-glucosyltransferase